jgi:hypothetical protein
MSNTDTWNNEGGKVEPEVEEYSYSPAAGLGNDTVEADNPADDDESGEVELEVSSALRGIFIDADTGKRYRRGQTVTVSEDEAGRLTEHKRRGRPIFVRTDS